MADVTSSISVTRSVQPHGGVAAVCSPHPQQRGTRCSADRRPEASSAKPLWCSRAAGWPRPPGTPSGSDTHTGSSGGDRARLGSDTGRGACARWGGVGAQGWPCSWTERGGRWTLRSWWSQCCPHGPSHRRLSRWSVHFKQETPQSLSKCRDKKTTSRSAPSTVT